jgi:hypothetical protein
MLIDYLMHAQIVRSVSLAPKALLFLKIDNFIRKPCIRLVRWTIFDALMLLVILANCVTLAMSSNQPGFSKSTTGHAVTLANYVFIGIFMAEAGIKIVAYGFVFGKYTYLRDGKSVSS